MKKLFLKHSILAVFAVFVLALAAPLAVNAQTTRAQEAQQNAEQRQETAQTNVADRKEAAQARLTDGKLKACENRQKAITNIMTRLADRGQKQLDLFSSIADKTEKFYTDKGKTLSNYDTLLADVDAKKAAAVTAVDTIKSASITFDCSGEDPKGLVKSFKESLKIEIEALKAYKTSVKNLIVGVKSVQGTTTTSENGDQQ